MKLNIKGRSLIKWSVFGIAAALIPSLPHLTGSTLAEQAASTPYYQTKVSKTDNTVAVKGSPGGESQSHRLLPRNDKNGSVDWGRLAVRQAAGRYTGQAASKSVWQKDPNGLSGDAASYVMNDLYSISAGSLLYEEYAQASNRYQVPPVFIDVEVKKFWDDDNDRDGIRPDSVTYELLVREIGSNGRPVAPWARAGYANAGYTTSPYAYPQPDGPIPARPNGPNPVTGLKASNYAYTFKNLLQYSPNANWLEYTVIETEIAKSNLQYIWNDEGGFAPGIDRAHTGYKSFDYRRETSLQSSTNPGDVSSVYHPLSHSNGSPASTQGADAEQYANGTFTSGMNRYTWRSEITNRHVPDRISVYGDKEWNDDNNRTGVRPSSIEVTLLADGVKATQANCGYTGPNPITVGRNDASEDERGGHLTNTDNGYDRVTHTPKQADANKWHFSFSGMVRYRQNGTPIQYTFQEKVISSKQMTRADGTTKDTISYTPVYTYKPANTSTDRSPITTNMPGEGTTFKAPLSGNQYGTIRNDETPKEINTSLTMKKYWLDDGDRDGYRNKTITFRVFVVDSDNQWIEVTNDNKRAYMTAAGAAAADFPIVLDPTKTNTTVSKETVDGQSADVWTRVISGFYVYENNNLDNTNGSAAKALRYQIEETQTDRHYNRPVVEGSGWKIRDDNPSGITTLTTKNIHTPDQVTINLTKYWNDDNDRDGIRKGKTLTFQLQSDAETAGTFKDVSGQTLKIAIDANGNVTLAQRPTGSTVAVQPGWTINSDNWAINNAFVGLPRRTGGRDIQYHIVETGLPGPDNGYTVQTVKWDASNHETTGAGKEMRMDTTESPDAHMYEMQAAKRNVYTPVKVKITAHKSWEDWNDRAGYRKYVNAEFQLQRKVGTYWSNIGNPQVIKGAGTNTTVVWDQTYEDNPLYRYENHGTAIEYRVVETVKYDTAAMDKDSLSADVRRRVLESYRLKDITSTGNASIKGASYEDNGNTRYPSLTLSFGAPASSVASSDLTFVNHGSIRRRMDVFKSFAGGPEEARRNLTMTFTLGSDLEQANTIKPTGKRAVLSIDGAGNMTATVNGESREVSVDAKNGVIRIHDAFTDLTDFVVENGTPREVKYTIIETIGGANADKWQTSHTSSTSPIFWLSNLSLDFENAGFYTGGGDWAKLVFHGESGDRSTWLLNGVFHAFCMDGDKKDAVNNYVYDPWYYGLKDTSKHEQLLRILYFGYGGPEDVTSLLKDKTEKERAYLTTRLIQNVLGKYSFTADEQEAADKILDRINSAPSLSSMRVQVTMFAAELNAANCPAGINPDEYQNLMFATFTTGNGVVNTYENPIH